MPNSVSSNFLGTWGLMVSFLRGTILLVNLKDKRKDEEKLNSLITRMKYRSLEKGREELRLAMKKGLAKQ